jgi:hypothetical protein
LIHYIKAHLISGLKFESFCARLRRSLDERTKHQKKRNNFPFSGDERVGADAGDVGGDALGLVLDGQPKSTSIVSRQKNDESFPIDYDAKDKVSGNFIEARSCACELCELAYADTGSVRMETLEGSILKKDPDGLQRA